MKAEIVSIGDEMTSGQRLDTNSQWLSQQLADIGIATARHTTVADELNDNIEVFRSASQRADVIISTGGLGPTLDDLTRDALASAFGQELLLDPASLEHIIGIFSRRSRPMPERNRAQAMLPRGSQAIHNPHGTAPGIDMTVGQEGGGRCRIFALPGVPAEMKQMWHESVLPAISDHFGFAGQSLRYHTIKVFGIGESDVEAKLPDLIRRDRIPRVGITVSQATISLRIADIAANTDEYARKIQPTVHEIESALGNLIFGAGDDELQDAVQCLLDQRNLTLATIEIGPASWISNWMLETNSTQSQLYLGGLALPDVGTAQRVLGLDRQDSSPNELYSRLAEAAAQRFSADIGLACGPYPDISSVEQGLPMAASDVTLALYQRGVPTTAETRPLGGHPDVIHHRISKAALDFVRLAIL